MGPKKEFVTLDFILILKALCGGLRRNLWHRLLKSYFFFTNFGHNRTGSVSISGIRIRNSAKLNLYNFNEPFSNFVSVLSSLSQCYRTLCK
jgi:hypothetical protein